MRLCIGDPAVAYLGITDRSTSAYRKTGRAASGCGWTATTSGSGLGSALYERAVGSRRSAAQDTWRPMFACSSLTNPPCAFFEKRGFVEVDREVPVMLDLTAFEPAAFARPAPEGMRLRSLAEAGDTEENRRKVYALDGIIHRDIPTHDVHAGTPRLRAVGQECWTARNMTLTRVILAENADGDVGRPERAGLSGAHQYRLDKHHRRPARVPGPGHGAGPETARPLTPPLRGAAR